MAAFTTRTSTDDQRVLEDKGYDFALEPVLVGADARIPPVRVGLPQPRLVLALGQIEVGEPPWAARLVQGASMRGSGSTCGSVTALRPR